MAYACGEILFTEYVATWRHFLALGLIIFNVILYFVRFRVAIALTGVTLLLATFNLLAFSVVIRTFQLKLFGVLTPEVQLISLLLLIVYCVLNFDFLVEWYLDYQEAKDNSHPEQ
jgi:hypothetical protein